MRRLIILPGEADNIFFLNELPYLQGYFHDILVLSYAGDPARHQKLAEERSFHCLTVKKQLWLKLFRPAFWSWLFSADTKAEIQREIRFSRAGLKKLAYILFYGFFSLDCQRLIMRYLAEASEGADKIAHTDKIESQDKIANDELYLYSFWLSRGAYALAQFKEKYQAVPGSLPIKWTFSRAHGYDLYLERNALHYLPFRAYLNAQLDEIAFISEKGRAYFAQTFPFTRDNGARKSLYYMGTDNPEQLRKRLLPKRHITVLSCAFISPIKRLDLIMELLSRVRLPIQWIHIGTGEGMAALEERAAHTFRAAQSFRFLGKVEQQDILPVILEEDVDFLINMSDSEGIPVSMMEALSLGIPVLAREVGGVAEIVDESCGLLLRDLTDLKQAALAVEGYLALRLNDTAAYQKLSDAALRRWADRFHAARNNEAFICAMIKQGEAGGQETEQAEAESMTDGADKVGEI